MFVDARWNQRCWESSTFFSSTALLVIFLFVSSEDQRRKASPLEMPCHGTNHISANSKTMVGPAGQRKRISAKLFDFFSLVETYRKLLLSINNKNMNQCLAKVVSCQCGETGVLLQIPSPVCLATGPTITPVLPLLG